MQHTCPHHYDDNSAEWYFSVGANARWIPNPLPTPARVDVSIRDANQTLGILSESTTLNRQSSLQGLSIGECGTGRCFSQCLQQNELMCGSRV